MTNETAFRWEKDTYLRAVDRTTQSSEFVSSGEEVGHGHYVVSSGDVVRNDGTLYVRTLTINGKVVNNDVIRTGCFGGS